MISRLVYGARNSLVVAIGAVIIGFVVGGVLGLLAGYFRGKVETVTMGAIDVLLSIPALILALSLVDLPRTTDGRLARVERDRRARDAHARVRPGRDPRARPHHPGEHARRGRSASSCSRRAPRARSTGGSCSARSCPTCCRRCSSIALLGIAVAIVAEGALSILGAGVEPTRPRGATSSSRASGTSPTGGRRTSCSSPSIFIFLTVLSLNFLGDVVRARFDVREGGL